MSVYRQQGFLHLTGLWYPNSLGRDFYVISALMFSTELVKRLPGETTVLSNYPINNNHLPRGILRGLKYPLEVGYSKLANHHTDKIQILLDINIEIYMF